MEGGRIFADPYACAILALTPDQAAAEEGTNEGRRRMRLFIAARARFAEDRIARAVAHGVRQVVVLGAGLDTFALRNPHRDMGLRVFEVDHPATQAWKRERLAAMKADIAPVFAPVDFERDALDERLTAAGFDWRASAFFMWLGVVPYLTREAARATLTMIARAPGAEVTFDYTEGRNRYHGEARAFHDALLARVAAAGEPIKSDFDPRELASELSALGLYEQEDLDVRAIAERYFRITRSSAQRPSAGHLIWARRPT
jgi:methyltransferase (TIGR00027 family)